MSCLTLVRRNMKHTNLFSLLHKSKNSSALSSWQQPYNDICNNESNDFHQNIDEEVQELLRTLKNNLQILKHDDVLFSSVVIDPSLCMKVKECSDIGQPTPSSHPHLFQSSNELTPGITSEEYAERRRRLLNLLGESEIGRSYSKHLVVLSAHDKKIMTNDIPYPFHQDTDFLYLTGLNEPDAIMVLEYNPNVSKICYMLFVKPKDPRKELWDGKVAGTQAAVDYFEADEAFPLDNFTSVMESRYGNLGEYSVWYKNKTLHSANREKIAQWLGMFNDSSLHEIGFNLQMFRLMKSPAEVNLMRKSALIAANAFAKVMQNTRPYMPEASLHALLEYECRVNGAQLLSFPPVVAGGNRANTLHYVNNTHVLRDGDLVLMDGGCEYYGYASDVTRTWPANGKFTPPQRDLYELVLKVQEKCLKTCKQGVSLDHLHHVMLTSLAEELVTIGMIDGNLSESKRQKLASRYCPHHLGHYLGMDTHDTPLLHRGLTLQPGIVITVEPGLYIPIDDPDAPEHYRGVGIRIEDDVLITKDGVYIMTASLPKQVHHIEELMMSAKRL